MSLQLLNKSLNLVNESDGIIEKSSNRKARKSAITEERELVRNLDERFQYDLEEAKLVKKRRDEIHKGKGDLSYMFNQKDAKNGYSLIEQFKDTRPPDVAAHNRKYIKYSDKYQIPHEIAKVCVASTIKKNKSKRKRLEARFNLRGTLYDKKRETKPKDKSVFSEADFDNITSLAENNMLQLKIKKLK